MEDNQFARKEKITGILFSIAAFAAWGILPLYWKMLSQIPSEEILAHRILWSFVFVGGIIIYSKKLSEVRKIASSLKSLSYILLSGLLVSVNWFTYIWAVNTNHLVEASMGYYMNPLIFVLLAVVVLKEKLGRIQIASIFLASIGVAVISIQYGKVPFIALILAVSFSLYGLMKKIVKVESVVGLALETFVITPFAFGYILLRQFNGAGILGTISLRLTITLFCAGIITAVPLLLFAKGAKRIPLATVGFIQYLCPTISLFIGIFVFKEQFTKTHFFSFGFIWSGLMLYSISQTGFLKKINSKFIKNVECSKSG